jgi:hypothetical protein
MVRKSGVRAGRSYEQIEASVTLVFSIVGKRLPAESAFVLLMTIQLEKRGITTTSAAGCKLQLSWPWGRGRQLAGAGPVSPKAAFSAVGAS